MSLYPSHGNSPSAIGAPDELDLAQAEVARLKAEGDRLLRDFNRLGAMVAAVEEAAWNSAIEAAAELAGGCPDLGDNHREAVLALRRGGGRWEVKNHSGFGKYNNCHPDNECWQECTSLVVDTLTEEQKADVLALRSRIAELTLDRDLDSRETLALVDRVDAADRERTRSNHRANIAEARAKKLEGLLSDFAGFADEIGTAFCEASPHSDAVKDAAAVAFRFWSISSGRTNAALADEGAEEKIFLTHDRGETEKSAQKIPENIPAPFESAKEVAERLGFAPRDHGLPESNEWPSGAKNGGRSELREKLAALAHEQWSGWMRHLFSKCEALPGTTTDDFKIRPVVIPLWAVTRWMRQMRAPYVDLSEEEKESDRKEADRVLALLEAST